MRRTAPLHCRRLWVLLLLPCVVCPAGCNGSRGHDVNDKVFVTPEQASAGRREKARSAWQEMALSILQIDRPDLAAGKSGDFALSVRSAGVTQTIDLSPVADDLIHRPEQERATLRAYLRQQLPGLDRRRLLDTGLEANRDRIEPLLVSGSQLDALGRGVGAARPSSAPASGTSSDAGTGGPGDLPAVEVVTDLYWLPVVTSTTGDAAVPVTREILRAWKVGEEDLRAIAWANLRRSFGTSAGTSAEARELGGAGAPPRAGPATDNAASNGAATNGAAFETLDLAALGRSGRLRAGTNPAVVLLPEFVASVRRAWGTEDDLVVALPYRAAVMFGERKNEKLLNRLIPSWRQTLDATRDPLCRNFIVVGDGKPALLNYTPPVIVLPSAKPASRPAPYIVR